MPDNRDGSTWNRKPAHSGSLKKLPALPKWLEAQGNVSRVQTISDVNTIAQYADGTEWNILKLVANKPKILRMLGGEVTFLWVRGEEERGNDLPAYVSSPTMLKWYHAGEKITKMSFKNLGSSNEAPGEKGLQDLYRTATTNPVNKNLQAPAAARQVGSPAGAPEGSNRVLNPLDVSSTDAYQNIARVRGESKNDPDSIARLLSEDVRTNNGFLYEAEDNNLSDREMMAYKNIARKGANSGPADTDPLAQVVNHAMALIKNFEAIDSDFRRVTQLRSSRPGSGYALKRFKSSVASILDSLRRLKNTEVLKDAPWETKQGFEFILDPIIRKMTDYKNRLEALYWDMSNEKIILAQEARIDSGDLQYYLRELNNFKAELNHGRIKSRPPMLDRAARRLDRWEERRRSGR